MQAETQIELIDQQDQQNFITVREAAELAEVSELTVRRWLDRGVLTRYQRPERREVRISAAQLHELNTWKPVTRA